MGKTSNKKRNQSKETVSNTTKMPSNTQVRSSDDVFGCKEFDIKLSAYFDKKLGKLNIANIEKHMSECAECKVKFDEYQKMIAVLKAAPMVKLPEGFKTGLHEKLVKARAEKSGVTISEDVKVSETANAVATQVVPGKEIEAVKVDNSRVKKTEKMEDYKAEMKVKSDKKENLKPLMKEFIKNIKKFSVRLLDWRICAPALTAILVISVFSTGILNKAIDSQDQNPQAPSTAELEQVAAAGENNGGIDPVGIVEGGEVLEPIYSNPDTNGDRNMTQGEVPIPTPTSDNTSSESAPISSPSIAPVENGKSQIDEGTDTNVLGSAKDEPGNRNVTGGTGGETESPVAIPAPVILDTDPPVAAPRSFKMTDTAEVSVYVLKTSDVSATLTKTGFAGRAITEGNKKILILSKSEYNQFISKLDLTSGGDDMGHNGTREVTNSYETPGCYRVEIMAK